jgi:hypothetical protein
MERFPGTLVVQNGLPEIGIRRTIASDVTSVSIRKFCFCSGTGSDTA